MISILSQPLEIEPVYSLDGANLSFVLDSTDNSNYAFRYVQAISVNGVPITETRIAPNIEGGFGKGVTQPNRILEDFLSYDKHTPIGFQKCENSFVQYDIQFGEESDGTLDGSGAGFTVSYGPTATGYVWNGTLQYEDDYDYTQYLIAGATGGTASFLTNAPISQDIQLEESSFLYWLNGVTANAVGGTISFTQPLAIHVMVYPQDGSSPDNYYILPNAALTPRCMASAGVGPEDINQAALNGNMYDDRFPGIPNTNPPITCDTLKYTVQLSNYSMPAGEATVNRSEVRTFFVNCGCETYTPYRFAWLNRLGGFDTYTFRLKSTRTVNITRKEYDRYLSRLNSENNTWGYEIGDRGRSVYDVKSFDAFTVVSTWQTAEEHSWLEEIFTSPAVYLVRGYSGGEMVYDPIIITKNSVEIRDKKGFGNRLLSHTIDFVKAYAKVSQRG